MGSFLSNYRIFHVIQPNSKGETTCMYQSWQQEHGKKLISAEKAVKLIKSGDWIDYGWCVGHPYLLIMEE